VAGLLEANGIFQMKLLVNRVRSDMIQKWHDVGSWRSGGFRSSTIRCYSEDSEIIISTNRGEPLVLKETIIIRIAFEAARRLVGKQDYFVDLNAPYKGLFAQFVHSIKNF
jgi:septum site-determining protein MinD